MIESYSFSLALSSSAGKATGSFLIFARKDFGLIAYGKSVLFQHSYMSNWLPPTKSVGLNGCIADGMIGCLLLTLAIVFLFLIFKLFRQAWADQNLPLQTALISATILSLSGLAITQTVKNAYEAILVIPLFGILVLISLKGVNLDRRRRGLILITTALVVVSVASQLNLWWTFAPRALGSWTEGGYLADQAASISPFAYSRFKRDTLAVARLCSIGHGQPTRNLVVDELTYPALSDTYRPMLMLSVSGD